MTPLTPPRRQQRAEQRGERRDERHDEPEDPLARLRALAGQAPASPAAGGSAGAGSEDPLARLRALAREDRPASGPAPGGEIPPPPSLPEPPRSSLAYERPLAPGEQPPRPEPLRPGIGEQVRGGVQAVGHAARHPIETAKAMATGIVRDARDTFRPVLGQGEMPGSTRFGDEGAIARSRSGFTVTRENTPGALTPGEHARAALNTGANLALGPATLLGDVVAGGVMGAISDPEQPFRGATAGALTAGTIRGGRAVVRGVRGARQPAPSQLPEAVAAALRDRVERADAQLVRGVENPGDLQVVAVRRRPGNVVTENAPGSPAALAEPVSAGGDLAALEALADELGIERVTAVRRRPRVVQEALAETDALGARRPSSPDTPFAPPPRPPVEPGPDAAPVSIGPEDFRTGPAPLVSSNGRFDARPGVLRRVNRELAAGAVDRTAEAIGGAGLPTQDSPDARRPRGRVGAAPPSVAIPDDLVERARSGAPLTAAELQLVLQDPELRAIRARAVREAPAPPPLVDEAPPPSQAPPALPARAASPMVAPAREPPPAPASAAPPADPLAALREVGADPTLRDPAAPPPPEPVRPARRKPQAKAVNPKFRLDSPDDLRARLAEVEARMEDYGQRPETAGWARFDDDESFMRTGNTAAGRRLADDARIVGEIREELRARGEPIEAVDPRLPPDPDEAFLDTESEAAWLGEGPPPPPGDAVAPDVVVRNAPEPRPAMASDTEAPRQQSDADYLNLTKFGPTDTPLGQSLAARIQDRVARLRAEGMVDKGYQSVADQTRLRDEYARKLLANPLEIDRTKLQRLDGYQVVALHDVVRENTAVLEAASRAVESGTLAGDDLTAALRTIDEAQRATDEALSAIVSEKASTARSLGYFRQVAKQSSDPAVWIVQARKLLGDRALPDDVMFEIRRLAKAVADTCAGGA